MKAIQITIDEDLLRRLDADERGRSWGRSAVIRALLSDYLRTRRNRQIEDAYRRGYTVAADLGEEFEGWEDQGEWPEK